MVEHSQVAASTKNRMVEEAEMGDLWDCSGGRLLIEMINTVASSQIGTACGRGMREIGLQRKGKALKW